MSFGDGIILFMDENNNDDSLKKYNELVFCFVDFYSFIPIFFYFHLELYWIRLKSLLNYEVNKYYN